MQGCQKGVFRVCDIGKNVGKMMGGGTKGGVGGCPKRPLLSNFGVALSFGGGRRGGIGLECVLWLVRGVFDLGGIPLSRICDSVSYLRARGVSIMTRKMRHSRIGFRMCWELTVGDLATGS